jgi:hypothetical protein
LRSAGFAAGCGSPSASLDTPPRQWRGASLRRSVLMMPTSVEARTSSSVALWTGRVAACFFMIVGALVFVSFFETGELWLLGVAVASLGGALLLIFGIEHRSRPASRWTRAVGWAAMAVPALVPSSLMLPALALLLLALPSVFVRSPERTA